MIVCSCFRVTERDVRAAVRDGAETVGDVGAACGAGTRCGTCHPALCELLRERQDGAARPLPYRWARTSTGPTGVPRAG